MRIGIICAGCDEVEPILKEMEITKTTEKAMLKIHEGTLWGIDTVALLCGACRVNAAIATQVMIDLYGVDKVIITPFGMKLFNIGVNASSDVPIHGRLRFRIQASSRQKTREINER